MNALVEIPIVLVLGAGGVSLFHLFGVKNPLLLSGLGILGSSVVSLVGFPISLVLGTSPFWIVLLLSAAVLVAALVKAWRSRDLWWGLWVFSLLVIFAWLLRFVVQVRERSGEDAISVMLQAVFEIQQGDPPSDLRRSYAYPLLIALGPEGTILASVTPLVTVSVLVVAISFAIELLPGERNGVRFWSISLGSALVVSAPILWIALAYTNSHVLMALAIAAGTGGVLVSIQTLSLNRPTVALLALSSLVGSATRFEGAFMMLVVLAPLLLGTFDYLAAKRALVLALSSAPALGLAHWTALSQAPLPISGILLFSLLLGTPMVMVAAGKMWGARAEKWFVVGGWLALVLLIVGGTIAIYSPPAIERFAIANFRNFILGVSGWGAVIPATLIAIIILFRKRGHRLYRIVTRTWAWGILLTTIAKLLDSPLANQGFNNTLSRTFLHWLGPLLLLWVIGLYSTLTAGAGKRSKDEQKPNVRVNPRHPEKNV